MRSLNEDQNFHLAMWFVHMRWIACAVSGALVGLSVWVVEYLPREAFWPLATLVGCLLASNVLFDLCVRRGWSGDYLQKVQIASDLVILTAMLHYSGGIENPAIFAYLFHVIISGILLNRRSCYVTVAAASILFGVLAFAEMGELLHHYTLQVFPHPAHGQGVFHAAHDPVYVTSLVGIQAMLMALTAYFTTTIMARLRAEERRAMAGHQRLQHVLQATGAGFAILDDQLSPVWLNAQIESWLHVSAGAGEIPHSEFERWTGGAGGPAAKTFQDGKVRVVERQNVDARGDKRFFQVTVGPLTDEAGKTYQVVELTQDITQRKMIEAEMMHSAKMAALGFMAAGIAHEVGNPLASISVRLRLLQEEHDEAFVKESLQVLQDQTNRIARIVQGVSQFARPSRGEWSEFQINDILVETLKILKFHKLAARGRIASELTDGLPRTTGVRDQLAQVFLNLGLNALEAMGDGGVLAITTYRSGDDICIKFTDTGRGIDSEIRDRIFDPFFSTKDTGQGLGLYVVHSIIDGHAGRIEVRPNPVGGSVFIVHLPIRQTGPGDGEQRQASQP